MAVEFPKFDF